MKYMIGILVLCFSTTVLGWGQVGHRVVAKIAENHLSRKAKKNINRILKGESLVRASVWADDVRSVESYDYLENQHFVSIEPGTNYRDHESEESEDVVQAILKNSAVLKSSASSKEEKKVAIRLLVHFVGDIHQPLHVGNGLDYGSNACMVKWHREVTNLHKVWDTLMIESWDASYSEIVEELLLPVSKEQKKHWLNSNVYDWVDESVEYRISVYPDFEGEWPPYCRKKGEKRKLDGKDFPKLSYSYEFQSRPIVEQRLQQAGIRLAKMLNDIFK